MILLKFWMSKALFETVDYGGKNYMHWCLCLTSGVQESFQENQEVKETRTLEKCDVFYSKRRRTSVCVEGVGVLCIEL